MTDQIISPLSGSFLHNVDRSLEIMPCPANKERERHRDGDLPETLHGCQRRECFWRGENELGIGILDPIEMNEIHA